MDRELVTRARAGDQLAFARLVEPYRRELHVHCYRILGSFADAEDALQETLLAAWRGLPGFEGRASVRTWLYTVATSRCLVALRTARRRPRVDWPPPGAALPAANQTFEPTWLEPYPDAVLGPVAAAPDDPEARYTARESISLAFVTVLQLLPPRQRAALVLRDVLGFHAREVAQMLDATEESVTSALKRARATLDREVRSDGRPAPPDAGSPEERRLVAELTRAYESADVARLVALLTDDVRLTMPPIPLAYVGRDPVAEFMAAFVFRPGTRFDARPTRANGQPALALALVGTPGAPHEPRGLMVFTLSGSQVRELTRFEVAALGPFGPDATLA
ncbi:RNA polymerase subunit sigma-70 [Xylanimonas sp. McL0601]|uniref:RNA polymerase subunit sigma-70 n=1 Tax=Xylanimonas sp. McL0601 TaxID=3414739 RepID=UPI003CEB1895